MIFIDSFYLHIFDSFFLIIHAFVGLFVHHLILLLFMIIQLY